jgi:ubiquinone/menaquinone biosynthesis C-methylase UbiE
MSAFPDGAPVGGAIFHEEIEMSVAEVTAEQIAGMSYNELIGLVRETNRPPGGRRTIYEIASRCMLRDRHRVLDIGTSTGATAIELAKLVGCEVIGIDINDASLAEARRRAAVHNLSTIRFQHADTTALPFPDEHFDLVMCGNVTVLVSDPASAFREYRRVLRVGGYLAATPMYYLSSPSPDLVDRVHRAVRVRLPVLDRREAVAFYDSDDFESIEQIDFRFRNLPDDEVVGFCKDLLAQPHLAALSWDARQQLERQYVESMLLFRENLSLMGFTVLIQRRTTAKEDPELFTAVPVS